MSEDVHQNDAQQHAIQKWREVEVWRREFDAEFAAFRAAMREYASCAAVESAVDEILAQDAAFLWSCGIKVD